MNRVMSVKEYISLWCFNELKSTRCEKFYKISIELKKKIKERNIKFNDLTKCEKNLLFNAIKKSDRKFFVKSLMKYNVLQLKHVNIDYLNSCFVVSGLGRKNFKTFKNLKPTFSQDPRKTLENIDENNLFDNLNPVLFIKNHIKRTVILEGTFRCCWYARDCNKINKNLLGYFPQRKQKKVKKKLK